MKRNDVLWILKVFIIWRVLLYVFSLLGLYVFDNQPLFLGGDSENYANNPLLWGWGNFDGLHYLSIAHEGYSPLRYFYFPLYPLLINLISPFTNILFLHLAALLISHISFFAALVGFWKLLSIDFKTGTVKLVLLCLLFFPTSFYLAAAYTESLFLATIVWSFYFARSGKWLASGMVGALSSATRIIGMALIPSFLVESMYQRPKRNKQSTLFIFLVSSGFLLYVLYLWKRTGNPLEFNAGSEVFGEYRSQSPLFLPVVFYRYIVKIIPNLTLSYFPVVFTTLLEFWVGTLLTLSAVVGFFRLRFSYWMFMVAGFVMPMMYNGFVSLPRYALVLFPLFILIGNFIKNKGNFIKAVYFFLNLICLFAATALFIRSYWVG